MQTLAHPVQPDNQTIRATLRLKHPLFNLANLA